MSLLVGLIAGLCGSAYFIYGRKQNLAVPMWAGAGLCVYPYFVNNVWGLVVIGVLLLALPFVVRE